ncbi:tryptophan-rich sensory protein [Hydrogenophaga sp.]|uniref:tryptophan-rich sensory protein n=1 Tax=Hydrogenophaga sp. TaxID=1904254 RepID=UPI00345D9891
MKFNTLNIGALARLPAAALASTSLIWPALAGRLWGPQNFRSGLWYQLLRKPSFKPPDVTIPLAWSAINSALAVSAYRLLRQAPMPERNQALGWWALNVALRSGPACLNRFTPRDKETACGLKRCRVVHGGGGRCATNRPTRWATRGAPGFSF